MDLPVMADCVGWREKARLAVRVPVVESAPCACVRAGTATATATATGGR